MNRQSIVSKQAILFFLSLVGLFSMLIACGEEMTPQSCDFTAKLLNIKIDEKRVLLFDDELVNAEIEKLEDIVREEEEQREGQESLANEAKPAGEPQHFEALSARGKVAAAQIDLLNKLKNSRQFTEKEMWLTLFNNLRWGDLVIDRAFLQRCDDRVVMKSETTAYSPQPLDSYLFQGSLESISQKNLYFAYSTPGEIAHLNDPTTEFRYLSPKKGRGFSTGFFVEDINLRNEWKVKVGWEAYREPLATRLAWALGFYVDEVLHLRELRVRYDDELESVFESEGKNIEDSLAGIVLKDGSFLNFINTGENELNVSELYKINRSSIRLLVFKSVALERRNPNIVRAGQWAFDALDNPDLRGVRLLGLLQFWLENPDIKFDNNRILLKCTQTDLPLQDIFRTCVETGTYNYEFVVHDLGLAFSAHPNDFAAAVDIRRESEDVASIKFSTRGRDVYAWRLITREDALVFADRLSQLTENQFRQALAASGYPYPAIVLLTEKLKARRNQFVQAVNSEIPLFEADLFISSDSSGSVDTGTNEPLLIPQDGFVVSNGAVVNDISLGNHGRHSEMIRE